MLLGWHACPVRLAGVHTDAAVCRRYGVCVYVIVVWLLRARVDAACERQEQPGMLRGVLGDVCSRFFGRAGCMHMCVGQLWPHEGGSVLCLLLWRGLIYCDGLVAMV